MKQIRITKGQFTLVDDADFPELSSHNWQCKFSRYSDTLYVSGWIINASGKRENVLMHRHIMGLTPHDGIYVDHINGNGLDNQRHNLRNSTMRQNIQNSRIHIDSTSGFKGVSFDSARGKWQAKINVQGKTKHLGRYLTAELAADAYGHAAQEVFGEFAKLNRNGEALR